MSYFVDRGWIEMFGYPVSLSCPPYFVMLIVTAGQVRFTSGDGRVDAEAGTVVDVPIGVPHTL